MPEAEPYVAHLRDQFDPVAKLGMPAHITLLYPFMSPELINVAVVEQARKIMSSASAFAFRLAKVCRFPDVLYLAPDPSRPFIDLTERLARQFPEFPPYGGKYKGVAPHLTVGHGSEVQQSRTQAELQVAVSACGGIACSAQKVTLMGNASGCWQQIHVFPLARAEHAAG